MIFEITNVKVLPGQMKQATKRVALAAEQPSLSCAALSRTLYCRTGNSPVMALRIEAWLGIERGGRAALWIAEQAAHDLSDSHDAHPVADARPRRERPLPWAACRW